MIGWLPTPKVTWKLVLLALVIVVLSAIVSSVGLRKFDWQPEWWADVRADLRGWKKDYRVLFHKTDFGIFRYLHMLALAYLAWALVGPRGAYLSVGRAWTFVVGVIRKVGQQSLAIFVFSMAFARFLGVAFDEFGRTPLSALVINLFGFATIIAVAYFVAWIKGQPWRKRA